MNTKENRIRLRSARNVIRPDGSMNQNTVISQVTWTLTINSRFVKAVTMPQKTSEPYLKAVTAAGEKERKATTRSWWQIPFMSKLRNHEDTLVFYYGQSQKWWEQAINYYKAANPEVHVPDDLFPPRFWSSPQIACACSNDYSHTFFIFSVLDFWAEHPSQAEMLLP